MLGLFGMLNLGARSLQTQQAGVEVTGHNLANVNNPAYARQRLNIQTSFSVPSQIGPQGTGAQAVAIQQLRDELLDGQIRSELSVGGYWDAQQRALHNAQAQLGEFLDRNADNIGSAALAGGADGSHGLADELSDLFDAFNSVATPASGNGDAERRVLISQAQSLASRFNQVSRQLDDLGTVLDSSLNSDVAQVNRLLAEIAELNEQIAKAEFPTGGTANDLRDLRQQALENLSKLVDIQTSNGAGGSVDVTIGGVQVVLGQQVPDTLETYDAGGGQILVRTVTGGTPLTLAGGSIQGTIDARDGALLNMQTSIDTLAATLITQVNNIHTTGFSVQDTTGAAFFTGTDAASIAVNATLVGDPSLVQTSGVLGNHGDNSIALALAQLADQTHGALNNRTFSDAYGDIVGGFGSALQGANDQIASHKVINTMLLQQRESVSGVSLDEEMTNLMTYQRAYQASARIVTTVDEMLVTVLSMKR